MDIVRQAVERLYTGIMTVTEHKSITDPVTKITSMQEEDVMTDIPCRISYKTISASSMQNGAAGISQSIKLFCAPEIVIAPGSKITVTQNGRTVAYKLSGEAAVYTSHQEIMLELFEEWA